MSNNRWYKATVAIEAVSFQQCLVGIFSRVLKTMRINVVAKNVIILTICVVQQGDQMPQTAIRK